MKVSVLTVWEQLASLQGWSELAADCDAAPFMWPSFCLPWWYEKGWGRLVSIAVEESGILVGLALVHDRTGDIGRHMVRFVGDEDYTYHQLLIADGRHDVAALLWDKLLSTGREIELSSVPMDIAKGYESDTSCSLALADDTETGLVVVSIDAGESLAPPRGSVRQVTDPDECVDLLTKTPDATQWAGDVPGSQTAAFFASAVDASARAGRVTLHVAEGPAGSSAGLLVLHGSRTSVVWRHVGHHGGTDPALIRSATADAAERGVLRLICPESATMSGHPFHLSDVRAVLSHGGWRELPSAARSAVRGFRDYLSS